MQSSRSAIAHGARAMSIRVSALYPAVAGSRFDFDYFLEKHVPLVFSLLAPHGCRHIEVDRGVPASDGEPVAYVAVGHMEFDSVQGFNEGFLANGETILADTPNYTNVSPVVQVSEMVSTVR